MVTESELIQELVLTWKDYNIRVFNFKDKNLFGFCLFFIFFVVLYYPKKILHRFIKTNLGRAYANTKKYISILFL